MGGTDSTTRIQRGSHHPKKLLAPVAEWFGDGGGSAWDITPEGAILPPTGLYYAWRAWREKGVLPDAGGWYDQDLATLTQLVALDTAYEAFMLAERPIDAGGGFSAMSETQKAVYVWLNN